MKPREYVPLAPFTTFGVGGPARHFLEARTESDIAAGATFATERGLPLFVLGGGSNLLVADEGFAGVVLRVMIAGIERDGDAPVVSAGAGVSWDEFAAWCVERNLAGVECLSGIPGSVGGTPIQNVGAYGQEVSETIRTVRAFDRDAGAFTDLDRAACGFAYRTSMFNTTRRDRYIVTRVTYALTPGGAAHLVYRDLVEAFAGHAGPPTLAATRAAVLAIRAGKAMVIEAGNPDTRSAGSFFKNPILPAAAADDVAGRAGVDLAAHPAGAGQVKLSAARLIEAAGFRRGHRRGGAGLSSRHVLALTNQDNATAREIFDLAREVRDAVRDRFGVELRPEPVFLGFDEAF